MNEPKFGQLPFVRPSVREGQFPIPDFYCRNPMALPPPAAHRCHQYCPASADIPRRRVCPGRELVVLAVLSAPTYSPGSSESSILMIDSRRDWPEQSRSGRVPPISGRVAVFVAYRIRTLGFETSCSDTFPSLSVKDWSRCGMTAASCPAAVGTRRFAVG
jgi:hypothetical protein